LAYDETLAQRIRELLADKHSVVEKRMFGGIAFMLRGNMCCGIVRDDLMVRVGLERHEEALAQPHARPMDFTGRPMRGMVYVTPEGCRTDEALKRWVEQGLNFAATLPPK
jgi:TfoX/Sxy family transcriptional regulator of competence genes